jgi:hypothetical protein
MTTTLKPAIQTDIDFNFFYRTCIICQNLQMQLIKGPTKLIQSSQPWPEHKNHYSQCVAISIFTKVL